jgi:hypothetical protein
MIKYESCPFCHGGQTLFDCEICRNNAFIEIEVDEDE